MAILAAWRHEAGWGVYSCAEDAEIDRIWESEPYVSASSRDLGLGHSCLYKQSESLPQGHEAMQRTHHGVELVNHLYHTLQLSILPWKEATYEELELRRRDLTLHSLQSLANTTVELSICSPNRRHRTTMALLQKQILSDIFNVARLEGLSIIEKLGGRDRFLNKRRNEFETDKLLRIYLDAETRLFPRIELLGDRGEATPQECQQPETTGAQKGGQAL